MSFSIKKQGEICVVDVEGQLIVGNRQELKQKVLDELEKGEKKFLIDLWLATRGPIQGSRDAWQPHSNTGHRSPRAVRGDHRRRRGDSHSPAP